MYVPIHPEGLGNCEATAPTGYICTRNSGHPGSHMANGTEGVVGIWDAEFELAKFRADVIPQEAWL